MDNQTNLTEDTVTGANQLDASEGSAAVDNTLSLAELNQYLGKDFKDKSTALKALKDTQSFVGKKIDAANPAPVQSVDTTLLSEVQQLKENLFYTENPQYKDMRGLIQKMGGNPSEVVASDEFKNLFEKVKVADEATSKKSVVSSNSRLGSVSTYAEDAVKVANATHSANDVSAILAKGIVEELGLN